MDEGPQSCREINEELITTNANRPRSCQLFHAISCSLSHLDLRTTNIQRTTCRPREEGSPPPRPRTAFSSLRRHAPSDSKPFTPFDVRLEEVSQHVVRSRKSSIWRALRARSALHLWSIFQTKVDLDDLVRERINVIHTVHRISSSSPGRRIPPSLEMLRLDELHQLLHVGIFAPKRAGHLFHVALQRVLFRRVALHHPLLQEHSQALFQATSIGAAVVARFMHTSISFISENQSLKEKSPRGASSAGELHRCSKSWQFFSSLIRARAAASSTKGILETAQP